MKNDTVPRGTQNGKSSVSEEDGAAAINRESETDNTRASTEKDAQKPKNKNRKKNADECAAHDVRQNASPQPRGKNDGKKKKKRNLWPLKAVIISFLLAFAVNAGSELVLEDAQLWLAVVLTLVILALGVLFDMIGTAATSCDVQPFLAMASRKVKGAKTAVKLAKNSDVVSSVCCDIVGDICGIVSGVCAATIAGKVILGNGADFWFSVLIYAVISMATISLKALGKGVAISKSNGIVFGVARLLSVFSRDK